MDIVSPAIMQSVLDFLSTPLSEKYPQFTIGILIGIIFVIIYLGQRNSNR